MKLINDKDNIVESIKFIKEYLELLKIIYIEKEKMVNEKNNLEKNSSKKEKAKKFEIKNEKNINDINLKAFEEHYKDLVDFQKKNTKYFLDFTYIIQKFINIYKNNLINLKQVYYIFKFELAQNSNYPIRDKLNITIDKLGKDLFNKGQLKNEQVLDFISFNDIYKSNKKGNINNNSFVKQYNDKYKEKKKINILNAIDINSKSDPIIQKISEYKTYKYFYDDMSNEYLNIFANKLSHIKNLGVFFIVLPKENYNYDSLIVLKEWIEKNINTFFVEECKTFNEDINTFIEILIKEANQYTNQFFDFLFRNLGDYCNILFVYLLNKNNFLKQPIIEKIILYYTSYVSYYNEYELFNVEQIYYFIEHLEKEDNNIFKIFYEKINNFAFNQTDFCCIEETNRFKLFELLLKHKKKYVLNKNGDYLSSIKKTCQDLIEKLRNEDFIYYEILPLLTYKEKLCDKTKLLLFFLSKEEEIGKEIIEESNQILNNITKDVLNIINNNKNLASLIYYLEEFFSENEEKIKQKNDINNYIKEICQKSIFSIAKNKEYTDKYQSFNNLIEEAKQNMNKKKNSLLFVEIYEDNKKKIKDQIYLLEETLNNFNSAVNIIKEDPEKIQNNNFIKYFYEIGYINEDNLDKEINWLINNFKIEISEEKKSKLLSSLKILVKKQNIINIIKGMITLTGIYENNIEQTDEEKYYFDELKNKYDLLKKEISSNDIKKIIDFIKEKFISITFDNNDKDYKNKILPFFNSFNKSQESFYFLKEKKIENIQNLKEFLLDSDEKELDLYDIDQFLKVIRFLNENINNIKSSFSLIQTFISGILDKDKFECYLYIINKINILKNFFDKFTKGEAGVFTKVREIMNKSDFTIYKSQNKNIYEIKGEYFKINNNDINIREKKIEISFDELDDLYQRIFISINRAGREYHTRGFIQFYKEIKLLNNIINKLFLIYGYPKDILIEFHMLKNNLDCNYESNNYKLKDLIKYFNDVKKKCKKYFDIFFSKNDEIRLFYGKQLYLINECLQKKEYGKISDLICCSTNGLIRKINTNFILEHNINDDIYEAMIKNINRFIKEQLSFNNKKIEDIYSMNTIIFFDYNKKEFYKGFYFFGSSVECYDVYSFYNNFTGAMPKNSNVLYCNPNTTNEEITIFILRSIYCPLNTLFMIIVPESLNNTQKTYIIQYLNRKSKKEAEMMKSCLIVCFNLRDDEFHQSIMKIKNIKLINQIKPEINSLEKNNVLTKIITSKICGLGKSTDIINNKNKNCRIIYLPIGGDISREDLIERLKEAIKDNLSDESIKYILHVDLAQTNEVELINDFLFKLLILHKCELDENVIYIRSNISIYIELANDFYSYLNTYKILSLFSEKPINKINKILVTKEAKIVSSTLAYFENDKILNNNVDIDNVCSKINIIDDNLILKHLGEIKNPNYYQINTFIKVLASEFEKFNKCLAFEPSTLKGNAFQMGIDEQGALKIRKSIVASIIKITKHFTIGPYEQLIKNQDRTNQYLKSDNVDEKNKKINELLKITINSITYDDIKPSLVVFNNDGFSVTILTTSKENENEFKELEQLYNSQNTEYQRIRLNQNNNKSTEISKLKNLQSLNNKEIIDKLLSFLDVNGLSEQELKKIIGNYVYTIDNYIKVVLILLRIRAKVPVIMMGETGCGKTTLIEMAFKLINKGNRTIKKLNIHAGTNDKDIIDFIKKITKEVDEEEQFLTNEERNNREIWVFFDEINTCNSMGLLSEIICKNTCRGNPIDKRYVFIGACNPYRLLLKERKMDAILIHKKAKKKKLVYSVNPLPHSLLNFVFNFGSLKEKDEKKYIESMTKKVTELYFKEYEVNNEEKKICDELIQMQVECISLAQNFVKENNDVSIVSLREVNRFLIFFKFFVEFFENRNKNDDKFNGEGYELIEDEIVTLYKNKNKIFFYESAINLSLFICYYLRLPDKETRNKLEQIINSQKYFNGDFLKIPSLEMNYVINSFIIPKGIAKNQALKENLFSALFCIANKIPLIICGKPGRSKTLCIQILQNSLKGKDASQSYLCKYFPELIIYKIQGALNTKTEDVVKVFKKARESMKENQNNIHLVLMDEMGLAELSINNPLKVTHFELENEEEKIPFIGITNWGLDSSKMNRVIYIVVQEPDEDDLIKTAEEIVKSYENDKDNYKQNYYEKYGIYIKNLSKAYYQFIEDKKNKNDEYKFFHGSRDFYSLIKNIMSDIIKNKKILEDDKNSNELINKICMKNIERNFGGLENSVNEFKSYFNKLLNVNIINENNQEYELLDCLKNSLYDNESRYLLMISDSSLSKDILNFMLDEINNKINEYRKSISNSNINEGNFEKLRKKEIKTFLGSKFKGDEKSIYYCDNILYKIKCQMETENIVILKDLEIVYPSLYELFNRSFINLQGLKFARLGQSKSLSLVNDKFKVIVLVDQRKIVKEDPPFLNRFEKHIISFLNILNNRLISLADEIYNVLKELLNVQALNYNSDSIDTKKNKKNKSSSILNKNIKFITNEEVRGLVYIASKKNITEKNEIIKFILEKISPTFTEDLMIIMEKFGFKAKNHFYYENIKNVYMNNYRYNFKDFLEKTENKLSIIYTFSYINEFLFDNDEIIKNNFFNEIINKKSVKEINIGEINSINIINKLILNFFTDNKYNLCVVRFREQDLIKLDDVHNLISDYLSRAYEINKINEENENQKKNSKIFIILIHISRINDLYTNKLNKGYDNNLNNNYFISFLSQTPQYFIDNINNKYSYFLNILNNSNENTIKDIIEKNKLIRSQLSYVIRYFSLNIVNKKPLYVKDLKIPLFKRSNEEINLEYVKNCINNYKNKFIYLFFKNQDLYN